MGVQRKNTTKIVNGEVVEVEDGEGAAMTTVMRSPTSREAGTFDVFGFLLDTRQCLVLIVLFILMTGISGTVGMILCLGAYHGFQRFVATRRPSSSSGSGASQSSRSGNGRGGGSSSRSNSSGGRRGPNIKGVKDLPCDPKGG
mmetsp:Transcript_1120/g.1575  ORF Transcript_1120/g.1575 Transcript_1120/m.1575 type:complete len:143 (-) Transcript_1120:263-691(-)|eukprot:CAMPEP_0194030704 /NCGR_PEP_ID=MMETSP0009_2-20130614/4080_1 /TAXON_ID=210454 /ORGANISM="Grammatophora oceanica, Strain CCMP 410" /LENGTH=142 /DNA_ID=CAMNT_0038670689 /DNA_START=129 /DNA_END=557 /DNA_ORIENTATION=+